METVLLVWIGLSIYLAISWSYIRILKVVELKPIRYSQSHIHSIVKPFLPPNKTIKKFTKSQSINHEKNHNIKVIIMDNIAYWIKDNTFYKASLSQDGMVDKETTQIVDTINMDGVQLDKMIFIIDKLREGFYDDSGGSGN